MCKHTLIVSFLQGTLAKTLAEKHGLVHLKMSTLLATHMNDHTTAARRYRFFTSRGRSVPPSVLIDLLNDWIANCDSPNGWILDGFPTSKAQAEAMVQDKIIPDKILLLHNDADASVAEKGHQRMDVETNKMYSLKNDEIPTEVAARLIHLPKHKDNIIRARLREASAPTSVSRYLNLSYYVFH